MSSAGPERPSPVPSWTSAAALAVLAAVLAAAGAIPIADAVWLVISVWAAFLPSGWTSSVGWTRRAAESTLIPVAAALLLVADLTSRRMIVPPLLLVAATVALLASLNRTAPHRRWVLWAAFGVAVRAAGGLGLMGVPPVHGALAAAATVAATVVAGRWGPRAGVSAGLVTVAVPLQSSPLASVAVIVLSVWLYPWARASTGRRDLPSGWMPGVVGASLLAAALAPWGGPQWTQAFPSAGWQLVLASVVAIAATMRLAPGPAGAVWFVVAVLAGPPQGPTPERFNAVLTVADAEVVLPVAGGGDYVVDLSLRSGAHLESGAPVAVLYTGADERVLRAGVEAAEATHRRADVAGRVRHAVPGTALWRPARVGGRTVWRVSGRTVLRIDPGSAPVVSRHPELPTNVDLVVESAGSPGPVAPRRWAMPSWIWSAALVVGLLQIASSGWRTSSLPWTVLVVGQLAARVWVEPLRLVAERHAVDLALAAVLAAWIPAAWRWFGRRRVFGAVAALMVPLAVATPHLTPPLYGDEPYHLRILESITLDRDLDVANNLDVTAHPGDRNYTLTDRLLHSPVLAFLLLPGYLLGGRAGALVMLALAGAWTASLIAKRSGGLGVPVSRSRLQLVVLVLSYPLATFATQIWVELPGAMMVAVISVAATGARAGPWLATAAAVVAAAVKTRLGLIVFPVAAAAWWVGDRPRARVGLPVLAVAAMAALAVGWVTLGHPFGFFRRLPDLLPGDPGLAVRVIGGLVFDPAGGLLLTAPLMLGGLICAVVLWRRGGAGERALLVGAGLTVLALLHSKEWYGGGSPPGRYLVPLLPVVVLSWGVWLTAPRRGRRLAEIAAAPSVLMWWALVSRPHLSVNPGDGRWWLSDALARRLQAEVQPFVPSFLVPTAATLWLPVAATVLVLAVVMGIRRRPALASGLVRCGVALWLAAALAVTAAVLIRLDRVVEAEAPQVTRMGGSPEPPWGTFSRYEHLRGWRVVDGQGIEVPLHLGPASSVWLEGWLEGPARSGAQLSVRWDGADPVTIEVRGEVTHGRVQLPAPPEAGRHRLRVGFLAAGGGAAVLDRVVVER